MSNKGPLKHCSQSGRVGNEVDELAAGEAAGFTLHSTGILKGCLDVTDLNLL